LDRAKSMIDLQLPIAILRRPFTARQRKFQPLQVQPPEQCHGLLDRLLIGRRMARQMAVEIGQMRHLEIQRPGIVLIRHQDVQHRDRL